MRRFVAQVYAECACRFVGYALREFTTPQLDEIKARIYRQALQPSRHTTLVPASAFAAAEIEEECS